MWTLVAIGFLAAQWAYAHIKKRWFTDPLPGPGFSVPRSNAGEAIPLVYGRRLVRSPLIIWTGLPKILTTDDNISYRYSIPVQFAICMSNMHVSTLAGPLPRLCSRGVWINNIRCSTSLVQPPIAEPGGVRLINVFNTTGTAEDHFTGTAEFSNGAWDVTPGARISGLQTGAIPYQGVATCLLSHGGSWTSGYVFGGSGSMPTVAFEVENGVHIPTVDQDLMTIGGGDANPAGVLYDLLVNPFGGRLGIDPDLVDVDAFAEVAQVLYDEGNGFSAVYYSPVEAQQIIEDVLKQIDGNLFQHPETLLWTLTLVREIEDVSVLPLYDDDDILDISLYEQSTFSDVPNTVYINYEARTIEEVQQLGQSLERLVYKDSSAMAVNSARQADKGVVLPETYPMPGISNPELADIVAARFLRSVALPLARATITVTRRGIFLAPGDAIRIKHRKLQDRTIVMRVARHDIGEFRSNGVVLNLVQDKWDFSRPLVPTPPNDQIGPTPPALITYGWTGEAPRYILGRAEDAGFQNRDTQRILYVAVDPGADNFRGLLVHGEDPAEQASIDTPGPRFSGTFTLDALYARETEPYDTTGITIENVEGWTPDTNYTDSQCRTRGAGLILIDEELMQYETVTSLGGGQYLLDNIRRGVADTVPQAHAAGARGFVIDVFTSLTPGFTNMVPNIGRTGLVLDDVVQTFVAPRSGLLEYLQDQLTPTEVEVRGRTHLPYPAADVKMGTKTIINDNGAIANIAETPAKTPNWMFEEGVDIEFKRRDRLNPYLIPGDDPDEVPVESQFILVIARKEDTDTEYVINTTAGSTIAAQQSLASAGHGTLNVSLRTRRQEGSSGDTINWDSWQDPTFQIFAYSWRNLLIYPRTSALTGWTAYAGTLVASSSGGPTYGAGYFTASVDPTSARQRVDVTGYFPARMRAGLTFYTKRQSADADDTIAVDLKTTNSSDTVQDTASYAATIGETAWTRHDLAIANADVDTTKLAVEFTMDAVGELDTTPQASISDLSLRLGQFTANQITNGSFESDLTGWTSAAGSYTVETSAPLEGSKYIQGGSNASNERYQDVAVPSGFQHSQAVVRFGVRHPGPSVNSEATITLESRTGAPAVINTETVTVALASLPDSTWYRGVAFIDVPYNAATVRIRLIATRLSGTTNSVQWDDVDIEFHKYLDPQTEVEIAFSPPSQPMPRSIGQWARNFPTVPHPNVCWLDGTLDPVLGYEPEFEVTDGAFADCKIVGLLDDGAPVSHPAFEVRRGEGGNVRTISNRTFGNFSTSQSFTVRIMYDCREEVGMADYGLAGRLGTTGWKLEYDSGDIRATLVGATSTKTTAVTGALPSGPTWAALVYNASTNLLYAMRPGGSTNISTSGMGEISCTEIIRLVFGAATDAGTSMSGLIGQCQIWNSALTLTQLDALWTQTGDSFPGYTNTDNGFASTSLAATVMGDDEEGCVLGFWSQGAVYNYVPSEETWGLACGVRTNLAAAWADPNAASGWDNTGVTATADDINGPDGRRSGILLTGTNAQYRRLQVPVAATATVNVVFFARADVAHTARVYLYSSAGVQKDTATVNLTTTWQVFRVAFDTWDGATADCHIRFYPSDTGSSQSMHLAGPVSVDQDTSDAFGSFIDLGGGTDLYYSLESLQGSDFGTYQLLDEGELELDVIALNASPSNANILSMYESGDNDKRTVKFNTGNIVFDHYDGAGANIASEIAAPDMRTLRTIRARWNKAGLLDAASAFAGLKIGTSIDYDRTSAWSSGSAQWDILELGGGGAFEGTITRLVCRAREEILPRSEF